jgi:hypothetical protein
VLPGKNQGFIRYHNIKGKKYASHCLSYREDGKVKQGTIYLGLVIDENLGVFKNQNRGIFCYTIEDGYLPAPTEYNNVFSTPNKQLSISKSLDFGDAWLFHEILFITGLISVFIRSLTLDDIDTFISLIAFKILDNTSYRNAFD